MRDTLATIFALVILVLLGLACTRCHRPEIEAMLVDGVSAELAGMAAADVGVSHEKRSIVLEGAVADEDERQRLVDAAYSVRGVRSVDDRLTVEAAPAVIAAEDFESGTAEAITESAAEVPIETEREAVAVEAPEIGCRERVLEAIGDRGVFFATDSATIPDDGRPWLDGVAAVLVACEDIRIELEGHADPRGDLDYNRRLSDRRAEAVATYLAERGIDRSRMITEAEGEEGPLVSDSAELQRHRRVDLLVVGGE